MSTAIKEAMTGPEMVALSKKHSLYEWSAQAHVDPIPMARSLGIYFWTPEGKRFIDFNSQLMCVNIGHGDPRVIKAIQDQAATLAYANPFMASEARARLAQKLASSEEARCTMAVWHRPPFSSGSHGDQSKVRPLYRSLYRHGVEILVNGHDHDYERMAPARPDGKVDGRFGVRQFVVGTGGAPLRPQGVDIAPHSRTFQATDHGVLRLTLRRHRYDWAFLPIAGRSFEDRGSARCHGRPR